MKKLWYIFIFVVCIQCRERYDVPFTSTSGSGFLVLEGFVNVSGKTLIKLSRTTKLSEARILPESGALLVVEGEDNSAFRLNEDSAGNYGSDILPLNPSVKYRLRITTLNTKEYASAFSTIINTPVIDSLSWKQNAEGLDIFVNAHDPQNNTHYYKWDYNETWQFYSTFVASLTFKPDPTGTYPYVLAYFDTSELINRKINTCWKYRSSTGINVASTLKLSSDVVYNPVLHIQHAAPEMSYLYSILVKQYSLSAEGFAFFEKMRKNTESVGSIFDAQPSDITGNITSLSDPGEPIVGFVEFSNVQEKRLFISKDELIDWGYKSPCKIFHETNPELLPYPYLNDPAIFKRILDRGVLPTLPFESYMGGGVKSFYAEEKECVDCTLLGSNIKPAYWP